MKELLNKLQSVDLKHSTPDDIRTMLEGYPITPIEFIINKGTYILRARCGKGFTKRSELTYCPVKKCTQLQRATLPNKTMFYGVISDDQGHQENARAVCMSECSFLCREGIESIGREYFSISSSSLSMLAESLNASRASAAFTFESLLRSAILI